MFALTPQQTCDCGRMEEHERTGDCGRMVSEADCGRVMVLRVLHDEFTGVVPAQQCPYAAMRPQSQAFDRIALLCLYSDASGGIIPQDVDDLGDDSVATGLVVGMGDLALE